MGVNVKRYRQFFGYNQNEFSELLSIKLGTYRAKEQGKSTFSDSEKIKIKEIFNKHDSSLSIDEIFFN